MRISDWSSDVCSSDLYAGLIPVPLPLTIHLGGHGAYVERLRTMIGKAAPQLAVGPAEMLPYLKEAAVGVRVIGTPEDFYNLPAEGGDRSEEHTSELQSLMRISYAVFCLNKKKKPTN